MSGIAWWQGGVFYEVYPRSFRDGNGDGLGDLAGIREKLDYFVWLGVDALWLTPVFPSPMVDFGYDIADYCDIDPLFGDLAAMDALIAEAHARKLRVILDFVANHTSDQHPWFLSSRSSRHSEKRDWYLWRDPAAGGGLPNNWTSVFGGSAWEWDEATGQYYYHAFATQQPDLNWRHPAVREAMQRVLRFWLDRNVDGFRLDAVARLIKDDRFRDNPDPMDMPMVDGLRRPDLTRAPYSRNLPQVHDVLAEFRAVIDAYGDRVLVGETYLPVTDLMAYYGGSRPEIQLPMNFHLMLRPWTADSIARLVEEYEAALPQGAWPSWVLSNHDNSRLASRLGLDQARIAAMLLLTLRGTPFLYYGDEIAMEDGDIAATEIVDVWELSTPGQGLGRDPARTPMQWEGDGRGGFTSGEPWLPVSPNTSEVNVAAEATDPMSTLTLYRRLLALRRAEPALTGGSWRSLGVQGGAFIYLRQAGRRRLLIALNLSDEPHALLLQRPLASGRILISTYLDRDREDVGEELDLRADEGVIVELASP